ncbi:MAG: sigma-70 family RNA polymerase sigma factor [Chloroflexi bacterium]|nr:sigma-70 family RNA polymerase sigma factor [Chloroflexota bacterium]
MLGRVVMMNLPERSDEELMSGVVRRESAALEILYDRYAASALGVALKILRERASAEDIVQETFWRVWKSAATFDSRRGAFPSWLFAMTRNLAIDELRRRAARQASDIDLDDAASEIPDCASDVMDAVWTQMQSERVREAIQQLSEPQRQVILLAYFQGLTRQEIAERLQEPAGTIHTRARLALQKLKTLLSGE